MKLFIYKSLIIIFLVFILFEITIGYRITNFKAEIENILGKKNREELIIKLKDEIKEANSKENILDQEERELLSTFIKKITQELNLR
tara:strand:- start:3845 stop:4105 length:261 start_codon:yes stop_codon:yes gene_type:complete